MPPTDVIAALYFLSDGDVEELRSDKLFVPGDHDNRNPADKGPESHLESGELDARSTSPSASPPLDPEGFDGPRLELRWNANRKTQPGFFVGSSKACDVIIARPKKYRGVSGVQGLFTFDGENRLIYRDLRDARVRGDGSAVSYNGRGGDKRRDFIWLLSDTEYINARAPEIVLQLHDRLKLRVYVPPRNWTPAERAAKVEAFRSHRRSDNTPYVDPPVSLEPLSMGGVIDTTAVPSGARTLPHSPILITTRTLGGGTYGTVKLVYDVGRGTYMARKRAVDKTKRPIKTLNGTRREYWDQEIYLLSQIKQASHSDPDFGRYLVQIISGTLEPPVIDLEYVPCGTLYDQNEQQSLSSQETWVVLEQTLKALSFLHGLDKPIAHRDVKANNILVVYRAETDAAGPAARGDREIIHIKLADFGFSKEGDNLQTVKVGTDRYRAPELFPKVPTSPGSADSPKMYTPAVDIWATGVMVYELAGGKLDTRHYSERNMCRQVLNTISARAAIKVVAESKMAAFVASYMVLWEASERCEARVCLQLAQEELGCGARDVGAAAYGDSSVNGGTDGCYDANMVRTGAAGGDSQSATMRPPGQVAVRPGARTPWASDKDILPQNNLGEWNRQECDFLQPSEERELGLPGSSVFPLNADHHIWGQEDFSVLWQGLPPLPDAKAMRPPGTSTRQLCDEFLVSGNSLYPPKEQLPSGPSASADKMRSFSQVAAQLTSSQVAPSADTGGRSTSDCIETGRPLGLRLPAPPSGAAADLSSGGGSSSQETAVPRNCAAQSPSARRPEARTPSSYRQALAPSFHQSAPKRFFDDGDGGQPPAESAAKRHQSVALAAPSPIPTTASAAATPSGRSGTASTSLYEDDEDDGGDAETRASSTSSAQQEMQATASLESLPPSSSVQQEMLETEQQLLPLQPGPDNGLRLGIRYDEDGGEVPTVIFGGSSAERSEFSEPASSSQRREEANEGQ